MRLRAALLHVGAGRICAKSLEISCWPVSKDQAGLLDEQLNSWNVQVSFKGVAALLASAPRRWHCSTASEPCSSRSSDSDASISKRHNSIAMWHGKASMVGSAASCQRPEETVHWFAETRRDSKFWLRFRPMSDWVFVGNSLLISNILPSGLHYVCHWTKKNLISWQLLAMDFWKAFKLTPLITNDFVSNFKKFEIASNFENR